MPVNSAGLVSIGYEGRTLGEFLDALSTVGVGVLADVRLTPLSRRPGFARTRLAAAAAEAAIRYLHLPALGNPRDNRPGFASAAARPAALERYAHLMAKPAGEAALEDLAATARREVVGVMCFERDMQRCHRQLVLAELTRRLGADTRVVYL